MPVLIRDKRFGLRHQVALESRDACLSVKRKLLGASEIASHAKRQLYVHVPLCFFHCSFCVYRGELTREGEGTEAYLADLAVESKMLAPLVGAMPFDSAFVGGGTVTVLSTSQLRRMLTLVRESFALSDTGEFTVELAPHGLNPSKLDVLVELGVNRVSMGVQSTDETLLNTVNRPALTDRRMAALVREINARPFLDANVDLMVGIPGRTFDNLLSDFLKLASWGCRSIMVYIDMLAYRDPARAGEAAAHKVMVEQLSQAVADGYVLNGNQGVNEYNRFVARGPDKQARFTARYSTDHADEELFCLGIGRQAQSWNRDMIVTWH
ncbi:Radical SAM superfamily protein [Agrobacterium fabrum]|uniref:Radical SAM superfamily protein n=1 Tax=Agrobacterium fabrum TaxID=1176649 RepID=A0A7Z7BQ11_9HYPH|nr:radical SAM protein [Agrobacterium fabrum]SDK03001.1 Radical SAM superfamily protein [Agrobacterium fabrum]